MKAKAHFLLAPILLGLVTVSCDKKDLDELTPDAALSAEGISLATSANLIFNETFEDGAGFEGNKLQASTSYGFTVASKPVLEGSKSGRFELRDTDAEASGGTRTEFLLNESTMVKEGWYSFAGYFPSAEYANESSREIITQWHQGSGSGSPTTVLVVENGEFILHMGSARLNLGKMAKDVWHQFVFHVVHSSGSDGLVEVWLNGNKVASKSGATIKSGFDLPRWKLGIYKWDWNGSKTTNTKKRVWYIDNVKMGNGNASYSDMVSGGSTTAPAPTPEPTPEVTPEPAPAPSTNLGITSLTLVNSSTERDIMTLNSGAILDFKALGTNRLNIRANATSTSVESIKFELTGAMNRTYVDDVAPHALFGDDGNGNYYYGNLTLPNGNYTLKVTPYSGNKATGTVGTPVTIKFTVGSSSTSTTSTSTKSNDRKTRYSDWKNWFYRNR